MRNIHNTHKYNYINAKKKDDKNAQLTHLLKRIDSIQRTEPFSHQALQYLEDAIQLADQTDQIKLIPDLFFRKLRILFFKTRYDRVIQNVRMLFKREKYRVDTWDDAATQKVVDLLAWVYVRIGEMELAEELLVENSMGLPQVDLALHAKDVVTARGILERTTFEGEMDELVGEYFLLIVEALDGKLDEKAYAAEVKGLQKNSPRCFRLLQQMFRVGGRGFSS